MIMHITKYEVKQKMYETIIVLNLFIYFHICTSISNPPNYPNYRSVIMSNCGHEKLFDQAAKSNCINSYC
jgi:hypothetical protein